MLQSRNLALNIELGLIILLIIDSAVKEDKINNVKITFRRKNNGFWTYVYWKLFLSFRVSNHKSIPSVLMFFVSTLYMVQYTSLSCMTIDFMK